MSEEIPSKAPFEYDDSNFIKDLFFTWIFPLTNFYRKEDPTEHNIFDTPKRLDFSENLKKVKIEWKKELKSKKPNIFFALWRVYKIKLLVAVLPGTFFYNTGLITSLMLLYIIDYINGKIDNVVPYIVAYAVVVQMNTIASNFSFSKLFIIVAQLKGILSQLIFEKSLKTYYGDISQGTAGGKITSLISSDLEFFEGMVLAPFFLSMPFFLCGAGIILWFNIGVSGIIGLLVAIFHLPIIMYFGKLFGKIRYATARIGDSRMKLITNLIEGIRIVKLYGWENPYLSTLFKMRASEISQHKKKAHISSTNKAINYGSMGLILFITFSTYVSLGNKLEPSTAFSSITILILSTSSVSIIGSLGMIQIYLIKTALERITQGLLMKEKLELTYEKPKKKQAISLKNCTFLWKEPNNFKENSEVELTRRDTENSFSLRGINLNAKRGELIIVIGAVGSGKSALCLGILHEIYLSHGNLAVNGSISLVSEEPWIVSGTIKDNILMGKEEDADFYYDVIDKCCLQKDLEQFKEYGDETMVGDRGITLSGGQKARVSLARAVYADKDIILLDDPLSAVDPEVCFKLFNDCIRGILKNKTVILATHQAHFVSQADKILILEDGRQIFFGTYQELLDQNLVSFLGKIEQTQEQEKHKAEIKDDKKPERQLTIKDKKSIVAEESAKGTVPFKIYYKFLMLGFKNIFIMILVFFLQILAQVSYLSIIYWIVFWANADDQENSKYIYGMAILVAILYLMTYFRVIFVTFPLLESAKKIHNLAVQSLAFTKSLFFDQNPTGRMLNRFAKDTSQIDEVLIMFILESIFSLSLVLGNFVTVIIITPYILIVLAGVLIYFFLLLRYFTPASKQLKRMELITKSPIISLLNSSVQGLATIRCLNLEKKLKNDMKSSIDLNFKAYISYQLMFRSMQMYLEFGPSCLALINIIVLVNVKDQITPGLAAMSISVTFTIMGYVGYLFKTLIETDNYMTSTQRLFEYAELDFEGKYEVNPDFKITKGKIKVDNLYMKYRENYDYALKNLNFTIEAGSKTGIIGRTGAGKSSVMQALFRLTNPQEGTIWIDGQDYMSAGLHDLRKQMSVIPQSATLFIASLRDNLDPFHEHEDDRIINVLKKVRLGSLLEALPKGLDSEINSAGLSLSAGQKQLVCLARAILRKNKIIMIDEATANVDSETDEFIQKQLNKRFKGCTLLIIAHRLRTIIDSDWIVVMDQGTTVEEGHPAALIQNKDSAFLNMINHCGPEESQFLLSRLQ